MMQDDRGRVIKLEAIGGLYTVREAARVLGVTYAALDSRVRRDKNLVVYRLGEARLVRLEDMGAWQDDRCG